MKRKNEAGRLMFRITVASFVEIGLSVLFYPLIFAVVLDGNILGVIWDEVALGFVCLMMFGIRAYRYVLKKRHEKIDDSFPDLPPTEAEYEGLEDCFK